MAEAAIPRRMCINMWEAAIRHVRSVMTAAAACQVIPARKAFPDVLTENGTVTVTGANSASRNIVTIMAAAASQATEAADLIPIMWRYAAGMKARAMAGKPPAG